jgi:DNA-binding response OmpR family regulator
MARILIVDDDPNNQRILNYTLAKKGYETIIAGNGEIALNLLGTTDVDLAILDMAMPVMDGLTLLKNIRAIQKFANLPIIILTGSGDDDERMRAEQQSIQGFLNKPASSKMILERVDGLLTKYAST